MTAHKLDSDEPFFREWTHRSPGQVRSLSRAAQFRSLLPTLAHGHPPALVVVGSKGKGTAVAHATSVLAAAGLRVGTITSPPFRTNRERVRINGVALSPQQYDQLASVVDHTLTLLGPATGGYLSPTGAYTLAGADFLTTAGADVLVLEEGLGGLSDEVSLFDPRAVTVTPIFAEHVGVLGENIAQITADLLGVVTADTAQVVTTTQLPEVAQMLRAVACGRVLEICEVPGIFTDAVPALGAANAAAGSATGAWLAASLGRALDHDAVARAAARVRLPGRLSVHRPAGRLLGTWVADAAISPAGIDAALRWCTDHVGTPDAVLASFPDSKDAKACFHALRDLPVQAVTAGAGHLRFDTWPGSGPLTGTGPAFADADREPGVVLALGTISFIAEVLDHVDAETEAWW